MTWGSDLGLLKKRKREKMCQSCQSKTKEKEISDIFSQICFVSVHNKNSWSYRIGLTLLHCVCATTNLHPNQFPCPSHHTTECRPHTLQEPQPTSGCEQEGKHRKAPKKSGAEEMRLSPRSPSTWDVSPIICAVSAVLLLKCYGLNAWVPPDSYAAGLIAPPCNGIGNWGL